MNGFVYNLPSKFISAKTNSDISAKNCPSSGNALLTYSEGSIKQIGL